MIIAEDNLNLIGELNFVDLVENNVMSSQEILQFIKSNFPIDWEKIQKVTVYKNYISIDQVTKQYSDLKDLYHLRRALFYSPMNKELVIPCNEGESKIFQYKLQVEMANYLNKTSVEFNVIELHNEDELFKHWYRELKRKLYEMKINDLRGLVIGSLYNFNFSFGRYANSEVLKKLDDLLDDNFPSYLDYRLELILLEEMVIENNSLNHDFPKIENFFSNKSSVSYVASEVKKIPFLLQKKDKLRENKFLIDYIKTDYLFFLDRFNETDHFNKTLQNSISTLFFNPFIDYQFVQLSKGSLINLGWISPDRLRKAIGLLNKDFNLENVFLYGKCGGLSSKKLGEFLTPGETKVNGDIIPINNKISISDRLDKFLCVSSPLLETKKWLFTEKTHGYSGIEMELYPIFSVLPQGIDSYIIYFISDKPLEKIKLSQSFELVTQRLDVLQTIFQEIVNLYE